ncbi:tetratricopeptide repeat protein [bacterium]|nr:tetratricopeptide repeat protein [bacterium]
MSEKKETDPEELSKEYFDKAYQYQVAGKLKHAIRCYLRSIELRPTAEAHTFLGWTYSFMGKYGEAIAECKKAIEVDPAFGNPYNDIGAYLIEIGNVEEAIPWFKRAMEAERYEPRHYPHFNLGRVLETQGKWVEAMEEYKRAVEFFPQYTLAQEALQRLQSRLN